MTPLPASSSPSPVTLPVLLPARPGCTLCELHAGRQSPGIPSEHIERREGEEGGRGAGVGQALLIVGQNPGLVEDRRGRPFQGRSGEIVRQVIIPPIRTQAPGLEIYVGNVARCATSSKTVIRPKCYKACLPFLSADITALLGVYSPLFILALGAPAATHLLKDLTGSKVTQKEAFSMNGTVLDHPCVHKPVVFFATYHPAFILRKPAMLPVLVDHTEMLIRHISGLTTPTTQPSIIPTRMPHVV